MSNSAEAPRTWRGNIPVTSLYTAGVGGTLFFRALKERGELLASPCPACKVSYFPAQQFCPHCLAELTETKPVPPDGEVSSFTRVHLDRDGARLPVPVTVVAAKLDGTDTVLVHYWLGKEPPRIGTRTRVRIKPKAKRVGSILDIEGFVPA